MAANYIFDRDTNEEMDQMAKDRHFSLLSRNGAFTVAYVDHGLNNVYLKSVCPIKECMAMGWFPESELFPTIERVTCTQGIYKMEYFPRVKSLKAALDPDQWAIYQTLRTVQGKIRYDLNSHRNHEMITLAFNTIKCDELRETMQEALDACANYGTEIGFEISPRNVAVKNGKLILLDVFFNAKKLEEVNKKRVKRMRGGLFF
ncbi:MAG: hypothetical protein ACRDCE_22960 [Cetobacterium sp.]|uniref:hypothetical protein n=1 Tax=Cetobacterium sp. TaxID=2071632 RepID=UPI003EE711E9